MPEQTVTAKPIVEVTVSKEKMTASLKVKGAEGMAYPRQEDLMNTLAE